MQKEKQRILELYKKKSLPHTMLLWGKASAKLKKQMVEDIASRIFAENNENNISRYRTQINEKQHPDFILTAPDKRDKIRLEKIHELQDLMLRAPFQSHERFILIHNAEKMTLQAQNALLKLIEEPPERNILFLTVSKPNSLLDTIKSRSVAVHIKKSYENRSSVFFDYSPYIKDFCELFDTSSIVSLKKQLSENIDFKKYDFSVNIKNIEIFAKKTIKKYSDLYKDKVQESSENNTFTPINENDLNNITMRMYLSLTAYITLSVFPEATRKIMKFLENKQFFSTDALLFNSIDFIVRAEKQKKRRNKL